ncbi:hypothetical protein HRE23_05995 [Enterococcus faecalis]|nr:hypothetical protein [Enterococcus faecalis]
MTEEELYKKVLKEPLRRIKITDLAIRCLGIEESVRYIYEKEIQKMVIQIMVIVRRSNRLNYCYNCLSERVETIIFID